jgi:hypothetical protein
MSKSFVLGFIVGVALLIVAGVGASRLQRRDAARIDAEELERKYQAELVEATPVELGALSEGQRIHSKLYTPYKQIKGNETISSLVAQAKGKSKIVETGVYPRLMPEITQPETPDNYFGNLAGESDAVIRGRVTKKTSQVTEDDSFIFTDYDVLIIEVFKNHASFPLTTGGSLTVTLPGGKVLLDGVIVKARDDAFAPLPLKNHEVILFLRFIPETSSYKVTRDTGSFELDGSTLRPLTGHSFPPGVLESQNAFLRTLRAVSNK